MNGDVLVASARGMIKSMGHYQAMSYCQTESHNPARSRKQRARFRELTRVISHCDRAGRKWREG